VVFALVPALQLVEGSAARSQRLEAKFAPFHAGDGIDFLENLPAALEWCHAPISISLDIPCQKESVNQPI
jgi:hypothetical protein